MGRQLNAIKYATIERLLREFRTAKALGILPDPPIDGDYDDFVDDLRAKLDEHSTPNAEGAVHFCDLPEGAVFVMPYDTFETALFMKLQVPDLDDPDCPAYDSNTVYLGTVKGDPDEPVLDTDGDTGITEEVIPATPEQRQQACKNIDVYMLRHQQEFKRIQDFADKVLGLINGNSE